MECFLTTGITFRNRAISKCVHFHGNREIVQVVKKCAEVMEFRESYSLFLGVTLN